MSHSPTVFSPPGTPLPDRTVGEIVAERPNQSRVFQAYGIDFCCQGNRTLREACERKGVALDSVVEQLEAELRDKPAPEWNPADLAAAELVDHIVKTHHQYLRDELPRLLTMAARVAQVHGPHTPSLIEIYGVLQHLAEDLSSHIVKEERILFPEIVRLANGDAPALPLDAPIRAMLHEHDDAGEDLLKLRALSGDYLPPDEACNTYRALFAGLAELEEDLHRHIHLENAVLFPKARQLADA